MLTTFTINSDDEILCCTAGGSPDGDSVPDLRRFTRREEWAELVVDWPMARLVKVWNRLPGVEPVQRFTDRETGIGRIWKALQKFEARIPPQTKTRRAYAAKRRPRTKKFRVRIRLAQRKPTKTDAVLRLLRQPEGATLKALREATGWQGHSVRGFLSGNVRKKLGLPVRSFVREGERVYSIAGSA